MEAHGGYLCLLEQSKIDSGLLVRLARQALALEGSLVDASLSVTTVPHRKVVRLAFDAPFTYGRQGAHWYERHHAFAQLLSLALKTTIHAYVLDPEEMEQVASYGGGHPVGGERLRYEDFEPGDVDMEEESNFERMKDRWPLGHLAYVFGVTRAELLKLPREKSTLYELNTDTVSRPARPATTPVSLPAYSG